jgi:hypothetical protein
MLLIHPFIVYVLLGHPHVPDRPSLAVLYGRYLSSGRVFSGSGPMWFALALLIFCAVLACVRIVRPVKEVSTDSPAHAPGNGALMAFGFVLVVTTFLVRIVQPIGTNVLNFQLCFFPQYIAAFIVGVVAGKHGWLEALAMSKPSRVAGWLGIIGGPIVLALVAWLGGPPPEDGPSLYDGGWNWQALGLATWEQLTGLCLSLGLLAWFYRRVNQSGRFATWLSDRAFAVYVLHAPVLVALTPVIRPVVSNPFAGAAILTLTGLISGFLLADLAKRLPGLREIL